MCLEQTQPKVMNAVRCSPAPMYMHMHVCLHPSVFEMLRMRRDPCHSDMPDQLIDRAAVRGTVLACRWKASRCGFRTRTFSLAGEKTEREGPAGGSLLVG